MEPSRTMNLAVSAHFRCEHPNNQKQVHLPTTSLTPINYNNSDNNDNPKSQFDHLISGKTVNLIQSLYQITNQLEKIAAQSQSNPLPINHQTIQSTLKSSSSSSYLKQQLPAAGVFWDIENCALNRSKSFFGFVDKIRRTLIASRYRETEFVCVCDTSSIERYVLEQLNLAQVNVIHVNAGSKNAADDKLKQLMIRFAEIVQQPPTIILISSDVNFISVISDLKHRSCAHIILLCRNRVSSALKATANEVYDFAEFIQDIELIEYTKPLEARLLVSNLPLYKHWFHVRACLNKLIENCGGKIVHLLADQAIIRFNCPENAERAHARLSNYRIYGRQLFVRCLTPPQHSQSDSRLHESNVGIRDSLSNSGLAASQTESPHSSESERPNHDFNRSLRTHSIDKSWCEWIHFKRNVAISSTPQLVANTQFISSHHLPRNSAAPTSEFTNLTSFNCERQSKPFSVNDQLKIWSEKEILQTMPSSMSQQPTATNGPAFKDYLPPTSILVAHKRNDPNIPISRLKPLFGTLSSMKMPNSHEHLNSNHNERPSHLITPPPEMDFPGSDPIQTPVELLVTNLDSSLEPNAIRKSLVEAFRQQQVQVVNVHILTTQQLPQHLSHYASFFKHLPHCYMKAIVKVASQRDAQVAVSQLHRTKLAGKRIIISYLNGDKLPPALMLKSEVAAIFDDIPSKRLPLVAFQELYEKRYHRSLPMADIYKLKDVIQVGCGGPIIGGALSGTLTGGVSDGGKYVQLNPTYQNSLVSVDQQSQHSGRSSSFHNEKMNSNESFRSDPNITLCSANPYKCSLHPCSDNLQTGWAEQESTLCLPSVYISLQVLGPRVHTLLQQHGGGLPLRNLLHCYQSEFQDTFDQNSPDVVPLEHLLTCIQGVEIAHCPSIGGKRLQWAEQNVDALRTGPLSIPSSSSSNSLASSCNGSIAGNSRRESNGRHSSARSNDSIASSSRPGSSLSQSSKQSAQSTANENIARQTSQFCREVRDLLKHQPHCMISFSRFVPAYHNHFGRQCCVYQYGFTRLIDLLESLPHVLQVLGEGSARSITLTHREQTKRFVADLLRLLKAQPAKQMLLSQLGDLYRTTFDRPFKVSEYGVCCVYDLLRDIWAGTLTITKVNGEYDDQQQDTLIQVPKREQTEEEKQRTRAFADEVIELLRSTPTLSMTFSKFIPCYHHYFNRQCKVSEFGFSKLIELLEALESECIELCSGGVQEEKMIRLNNEQRKAALFTRFYQIVQQSGSKHMSIGQIERAFLLQYGFQVNFLEYGCDGMLEFFQQMPILFELQDNSIVSIVDERLIQAHRKRLLLTLMESAECRLSLSQLAYIYSNVYSVYFEPSILDEPLIGRFLQQNATSVWLRPVVRLIRNCIVIVQKNDSNQMSLKHLEDEFQSTFGLLPKPTDFGFKTWVQLFGCYGDLIVIHKRQDQGRIKWMLTINRNLIDRTLRMRFPSVTGESVNEFLAEFQNAHSFADHTFKNTFDHSDSKSKSPVNAPDSPQSLPEHPGVPSSVKAPLVVPLPPNEWLNSIASDDPTSPNLECNFNLSDYPHELTETFEQHDFTVKATSSVPLPTNLIRKKSRIAANFHLLN